MGWRSTGAAFRAGTYNGPLTSDEGGFASGFASTFAPAISAAADAFVQTRRDEREHERTLERIRLQETLRTTRSAASRSGSSETTTARQLREAQAFAELHDIPVEEAITLLENHNWNSEQAGDTVEANHATGVTVTGLVPDVPEPADTVEPVEPVTPADPVESSAVEPDPTDDIESTEPTALSDLAPAVGYSVEEEGYTQIASRGDVVTDVPVSWADYALGSGQSPEEVAATIVASADPEELSYPAQIEAGATGPEAVAVAQAAVESSTYDPRRTPMPQIDEVNSLDEARAALVLLDARREGLGGQDDFDRQYRPALMGLIDTFTVLPDVSEWLRDNNRDAMEEYLRSGWQQYEGIVDPDRLNQHIGSVRSALRNAASLPEIPGTLDELQALQANIESGQLGDRYLIPQEYREAVTRRLREEQIQAEYGDRLTVTYIMDDDRTLRELEGLLRITQGSLGAEHSITRMIAEAIQLREDMPDAPSIRLREVSANNYLGLAAEAQAAGNDALAQQIMSMGQAYVEAEGRPDTLQALSNISTMAARYSTIENEANARSAAFVSAVSAGTELARIVGENPNVLTFVGGTVPQVMDRVFRELQAFDREVSDDLVNRNLDLYISDIQAQEERGVLSESAAARAIYEAQEARLAYMIVRTQQGPAGVISNQDFNVALTSIRASVSGATFETSLRELLSRDAVGVTAALNAFHNNSQVGAVATFAEQAGVEFNPHSYVPRTYQQAFANLGQSEALGWITGEVSFAQDVMAPEQTPPPVEPAETDTPDTGPALGTAENPYEVSTPAQAAELPEGSYYRTPNGNLMRR